MNRIKQFLHRILDFLKQSHRWSHLIGGFAVGLVFGFGAALCAASALEWKNTQNDPTNNLVYFPRWNWRCWDWTDFTLTVAGDVIGSVIRWLVVGRFM